MFQEIEQPSLSRGILSIPFKVPKILTNNTKEIFQMRGFFFFSFSLFFFFFFLESEQTLPLDWVTVELDKCQFAWVCNVNWNNYFKPSLGYFKTGFWRSTLICVFLGWISTATIRSFPILTFTMWFWQMHLLTIFRLIEMNSVSSF